MTDRSKPPQRISRIGTYNHPNLTLKEATTASQRGSGDPPRPIGMTLDELIDYAKCRFCDADTEWLRRWLGDVVEFEPVVPGWIDRKQWPNAGDRLLTTAMRKALESLIMEREVPAKWQVSDTTT